ncbi:MAG: hypothetical protein AAF466_01345 [Bacteroidota bacterium]
MKLPILIFMSALVLLSCRSEENKIIVTKVEPFVEISFVTPDSIKIYGDLYDAGKDRTSILLFHQGGSNARAEYSPIIPTLLEQGYNILAIDQRMGGQYYGGYNRTLVHIPTYIFGDGYGYCDAYNNLESALDFMIESGFGGKKILWGSSYSASLAIQLANNRQGDVAGVLAFSPASGGPMKDCLPDPYFETLKKPLLMLRPQSEMTSERSQTQFRVADSLGHSTYVANHSIHGSSMLVSERVRENVDDTWEVVHKFLRKVEEH